MERHLGVALLLKVRDDGLPDQLGVAHHVQHLVVLAVDQRQLEAELGRVDVEHPGAALAVQAVHVLTFDTGDVDGYIQGADDSMVSVHGRNNGDGKLKHWFNYSKLSNILTKILSLIILIHLFFSPKGIMYQSIHLFYIQECLVFKQSLS